MKVTFKHIAVLTFLYLSQAVSSIKIAKEKALPVTPKALDLLDHYGTEPVQNIYGPQHVMMRLAREGVPEGAGVPITPISNFGQEINPAEVVSGDLNNISFDASKIIKAPIARIYYI